MYLDVRMGKRGEIVIPAAIRKALNVSSGSSFMLSTQDKRIELVPKDADVTSFILEFSNKYGSKGKRIKMGNELYGEVF